MSEADQILRHDWWDPGERFPRLRWVLPNGEVLLSCRACGRNLLKDRSNENAACPGVVHVTLRKVSS